MRHRVAFYPCCYLDVVEPLALLAPYANEVVLCDIDSKLLPIWEKAIASQTSKVKVSFLVGDVRQVVSSLKSVDVLFYRGDSPGEGGSGVFVLGDSFLPRILERLNPEGSLIITDGSNSRGGNFKKMIRPNGMTKHGWLFLPYPEQPYVEKHNLHIISAKLAQAVQPIIPPDLAHLSTQGR